MIFQRLRVFVSSKMQELAPERQARIGNTKDILAPALPELNPCGRWAPSVTCRRAQPAAAARSQAGRGDAVVPRLRIERTGTANRGHLLVGVPGYQEFDSLAVDGAGYVCVATLHNDGITVISPDGNSVEHVPTPDPVTTNICFGSADLRTAYITLSQTGRLVTRPWPRPGLALHYLYR